MWDLVTDGNFKCCKNSFDEELVGRSLEYLLYGSSINNIYVWNISYANKL